MLNAAVASRDLKSGENLRACLEQTGLVNPVMGFTIPADLKLKPGSGRPHPEIMLLDLSSDIGPYFDVAAQFRRAHPTGLVIACPSSQVNSDLLLQAMRAGVNDVLPKPIDPPTLEAVLGRFINDHGAADRQHNRKITFVIGVKGGVGTSTVAINLGVQLTQLSNKRALLIDLARPLGQVAVLLDLKPRFSISDAIANIECLDASFLGGLLTRHQSCLEVLTGTSHVNEWETVSISSIRRILNVAQNIFNFVVIDFGSCFSNEWMPVFELARTVVIVAEPNVPAFSNLRRIIPAFAPPLFPRERIRVVVNRCEPQRDQARKLEEIAGFPITAWLPSDFGQVSEAINLGRPLSRKSKKPLLGQLQLLACDVASIETPRFRASVGF